MENIAVISYGLATLAYLFFALLLLTTKSKTLPSMLLLITTICSTLWAAQVPFAFYSKQLLYSDNIYFDALRSLCWIIFLLAISSTKGRLIPLLLKSRLLQGSIVIFVMMLLNRFLPIIKNTLSAYISWDPSFLGGLLLLCLVLVTIEQLFRSADEQMRWAIKPLIIALSILFIFDFYMYAQAALFGAIEHVIWTSRGFIHLAALPALLISTKRTSQWSTRIFISRGVVYHGSLLVVAGTYLTIMSIMGYYIKYLGGEWGSIIRVVFFVLALLMLSFIFMSEPFRLKVKVFIGKHFFANSYEYRDEWLAVTSALSHPAKQCSTYEHTLTVMMERLGCKQGCFFRINDQALELKSNLDFELIDEANLITSLQRTLPFIRNSHWIIDTDEFKRIPQHYPELVMDTHLLQQNIWLLIPIFDGDSLIALLMMAHSKRLKKLNWEDRDYINTIGNQLANFVVLHEASAQLAEAKQFDTFNQMSAFLVHDLKNTLAQLSMIVVNSEKHKKNPEFIEDSLDTLANAVKRMQRMLDQLKRNKPLQKRQRKVEITELLAKICQNLSNNQPVPQVISQQKITLLAEKDGLENIITHLVQNAQDATEGDGRVQVSAFLEHNWLAVKVEDSGTGMDNAFIRERLFIPFDTTKGNAGMGIGVYEVRQFAIKAGGRLEVTSTLGEGTCFTLYLPTKINV